MDQTITAFLNHVPIAVLGTQRADGTTRQSAVYFVVDGDAIYVSTERTRQKARDVIRAGRASLCVVGPAAPYPSVTLEGAAAIVETRIAAITGRIFARMAGGDPPTLSDDDLAAMDRVLIRIDVDRVYGASYLADPHQQQNI